MKPLALLCCGFLLLPFAAADDRPPAGPFAGWEGHRNRLLPDPLPTATQKFGYSPTRHAGGPTPGEIGGRVQRSFTPAWYAKPIPTRTLNDKLAASGTFAVRQADGSSGTCFGWFHHDNRGWRAANALNFRVDGNGDKFWVFFEYGTTSLFTGGVGCFEGRQYQKTKTKPFPADGRVHTWELLYDPAATGGNGEVAFTLDGTRYALPLAPGHKADGAAFDRFGVWNHQIGGKGMDVYFGNLSLDGAAVDLSADPKWEGVGNDGAFPQRVVRPRHDFGFSPTRFCGGKEPGEVGGVVWRDVAPAYYAAPVGPLSLDHPLEATGTISLRAAASDSGVTFGWFDAKTLTAGEKPANRLALMIEGPSRVGHYFRPDVAADGARATKADGPRILPDGKPHTWALRYDPAGANGAGRITFRLDAAEGTFDLKPGQRAAGATFDRFGVFSREPADGNFVELYLADLKFTAKPPR